MTDGNITNDPNTVALADTVDQTSKAVIRILPPDKIKKMRAKYIAKVGTKPTEDEDVAKEQLSALFVAVTIMMSVYADFALWVPFWKRMLKKKRFMGRVPDEHGELQTVEILGPGSFDAWETCYNVFVTACLMLEIISAGALKRYLLHIKSLVKRFPGCWAVIYQADARMRSEKAPRIKE